ncbi:aminomethyl-transferring glycine dehydrogenase [Ereboglobus luteus]|uniref:Glycine dehydrogenase (decarboxylating) n=1 Tax=Ereboglobus luteus TaxID=1796921 RepID=A0A2U8E0C4_9BACT|nr:aminomethyl-transferring glycine dehydrogenase [Ereboglobus luteus]AWI08261.1 glycine dehydrogenase (aminomethyl-transferring) [Ereboglobus luteus]
MTNPTPAETVSDVFAPRHNSPTEADVAKMLETLGQPSLDALIDATVPAGIRLGREMKLPAAAGESDALAELLAVARQNEMRRSFIGRGYYGTRTPSVIRRAILENPGWYTAYTPYQAEISQGRLEALLNFQTLVTDLTALDIANASLLDEATAAAEAMTLCHRMANNAARNTFFVSDACHPQTIDLIRTRAEPLGINVVTGDHAKAAPDATWCGAIVQYPDTRGNICDYAGFFARAHEAGALCVVAADLLALTLLRAPGEFGADVAVGSTQRLGVPMGFGGPHAGYMATKDACKRQMPGRLVGVSKDAQGAPALRLALGTREQHIRRDKATSNICTAQVLLAVMASMYAVYHGPEGLRKIARRAHAHTLRLQSALQAAGIATNDAPVFDTLCIQNVDASVIHARASAKQVNLRAIDASTVGVSLDETTTDADVEDLIQIIAGKSVSPIPQSAIRNPHFRTSAFLTHPVFNSYHTEHEMLRYIKRLEARDLSLCHSMISLGSCTMKLNAASEMLPITWPEFAALHPFAPAEQARGYEKLFSDLETWLAEITGFAAVSLQPNSGANGEYAGIITIRRYLIAQGQGRRNICLIPVSAHGTNPATAVMAGMKVVVVACDAAGNIDVADLRAKAAEHADNLAAIMVTYPSTHGVFEAPIREICDIVHSHGGQVYMDGANMNAQVGLTSPGHIGADVCHLNLHKTFAIPHGGGGPGVGPIGVAKHLAPFLPGHSQYNTPGAVSAAPHGSASVQPITWMYIRMMGAAGLTMATKLAILNANYIARRLDAHYPILYKGATGHVAHECIIDCRQFKKHGIEVDDIAKRLQDYNYHAPTMSFPVPGTLMIEPTESESLVELDRFCDALIAIAKEIADVVEGRADKTNNVLKNAPHTAKVVCADTWDRPYSREQAAFPTAWVREHKFWPSVGRVDNVYGDRNLVCSCPPLPADA